MSDAYSLAELKFKGKRTYVHGTDLFDSISHFFKTFGEGFVKDLSFRSFATQQCTIHLETPQKAMASIVCQGRWRDCMEKKDTRFWVTETDEAVTDRYEFDEAVLCEGAHITNTNVCRKFNPEFLMIENIVALTKLHHNEKLPLSSGKWVFGQIVLNEKLPDNAQVIEMKNYQNIKDRFSRNYILIDGQKVGEIRFIVS